LGDRKGIKNPPIENLLLFIPVIIFSPLAGNSHGQAAHTRASVTKQYNLVPADGWAVTPFGWEGNCRPGGK